MQFAFIKISSFLPSFETEKLVLEVKVFGFFLHLAHKELCFYSHSLLLLLFVCWITLNRGTICMLHVYIWILFQFGSNCPEYICSSTITSDCCQLIEISLYYTDSCPVCYIFFNSNLWQTTRFCILLRACMLFCILSSVGYIFRGT